MERIIVVLTYFKKIIIYFNFLNKIVTTSIPGAGNVV